MRFLLLCVHSFARAHDQTKQHANICLHTARTSIWRQCTSIMCEKVRFRLHVAHPVRRTHTHMLAFSLSLWLCVSLCVCVRVRVCLSLSLLPFRSVSLAFSLSLSLSYFHSSLTRGTLSASGREYCTFEHKKKKANRSR